MEIKQIIGITFACVSFVWDVILTILWIVHKVKHTDPAKVKAAKQEKQIKRDQRHMEKLNARLEKIEKKYKVEVKK